MSRSGSAAAAGSSGGGCWRSHCWVVWWIRSSLPWVWGWPGRPVMQRPPNASRCSTSRLRRPRRVVLNADPLSVSRTCGTWWAAIPLSSTRTAPAAVSSCSTCAASRNRDRSSISWYTCQIDPSANGHSKLSSCQHPWTVADSNRRVADRGRFCGCGVTIPRRVNTRASVEAAGAGRPRAARWWATVTGPWSQPASASSLRSSTAASSTATGIANGERLPGSRRRGDNAASGPSAAARARSW